MWLKDGEFSRDLEEQYLAFILASEKIVNKGKSSEVPMPLPMRVWNSSEYTKFLNWYSTDKKFRAEAIAGLVNSSGNSEWSRERVAIGTLIRDGMPKEAERIYWEKEWNFDESAEWSLALIHSSPGAESLYTNYKAMWFFYVPGSRPSRPMTFDALKSLLLEGRLMGNCFVWRKGFKKWTPVTSVNCLAPFVYADDELPPPVDV
jgi:GYF domain 2